MYFFFCYYQCSHFWYCTSCQWAHLLSCYFFYYFRHICLICDAHSFCLCILFRDISLQNCLYLFLISFCNVLYSVLDINIVYCLLLIKNFMALPNLYSCWILPRRNQMKVYQNVSDQEQSIQILKGHFWICAQVHQLKGVHHVHRCTSDIG